MMHAVRGYSRFAHIDGLVRSDPAVCARLPQVHRDESRTQGLDRMELIRFLQVAQTISVHHGAWPALLGINALRASKAATVRIEGYADTLRDIGCSTHPVPQRPHRRCERVIRPFGQARDRLGKAHECVLPRSTTSPQAPDDAAFRAVVSISGSPNSLWIPENRSFESVPALVKAFWCPDDECFSPCRSRWW